jgi:hypothetical protein
LTNAANAVVKNSIIYDNGNGTEGNQLSIDASTTPIVSACTIEGWTGALGGSGNNGDDPVLADPNGADNLFGTLDDNLQLLQCSSAIDSAESTNLPNDPDDVNTDGDTAGGYPVDANALSRFTDDPGVLPNSPSELVPGPLDRGAIEFQGDSSGTCLGDVFPTNGNGVVNIDDLFGLLGVFGSDDAEFDIAPPCGNGVIDIDDLFVIIAQFGNCP